jgi:hypothetical protein
MMREYGRGIGPPNGIGPVFKNGNDPGFFDLGVFRHGVRFLECVRSAQ